MAKILVVDDIPANIKIIGEILKNNYDILVANSGTKAISIIEEILPDLILLDVMMPDIDGFSVCRKLKSNDRTKEIPVIFITAKNETTDIVEGFNAGGQDYITKPFRPEELAARVKTHIELKKTNETLAQYVEELSLKNNELNEMVKKLEIMSRTDYLTNIANRRHMTERIKEEIARSNRNGSDFSLIIADIDLFKRLNDTYGHECGDFVIKKVAEVMGEMIREQDMVARWGGEEFLLLLPETDKAGAAIVAEKIRERIEKYLFVYEKDPLPVTLTMGVTQYNHEETLDRNIHDADDALYNGKADGRNRISLA